MQDIKCSKGKACGNSCISRTYNCSKGAGCACNGKASSKISVLHLSIPYVEVGHIQYGAGLTFSSGSEYGVVDQDGYYTYEKDEPVTFRFGNSDLTINPADSRSLYDSCNLVFCYGIKGDFYMGWKGTVRSIGAAVRAAERDAKRRQRELEKQQKQYDKMQELERAKYEVDVYDNSIDLLLSVHKECSDSIDWHSIKSSPEPQKPEDIKDRERKEREKSDSYEMGFFDRLFNREEKIRKRFDEIINRAIDGDAYENRINLKEWNEKYSDWEESVSLAREIIENYDESKIMVIEAVDNFSDISALGTSVSFSTVDNQVIEATINAHGSDIFPNRIKTLLKSGRLSVKQMPKGKFNELYQDYVCGCVLRVANEIFSVVVSRNTIQSLNVDEIDPSDSMSNFVHNMKFNKIKGFESVEPIRPESLLRATG